MHPLALLISCFCLMVFATASRGRDGPLSSASSSSSEEQSILANQESYVVGIGGGSRFLRRQQPLDALMRFKVSYDAEVLSGQELVDYVNRHQDLWTASLNNKFADYDQDVKYGLMGVDYVRHSISALKKLGKSRFLNIDLPTNFDAREQWPNCQSIQVIRDQSACGSCWAFGAVEAMSDRVCIASGGKIQVSISADDLLSCCTACGFGCDGGEPLAAWQYWKSDGLVTGSNFTMHSGCRPYPFPPCEHHSNKTHFQPCKHDLYPTPKCEHTCQNSYTTRTYEQDKYYGKSAYAIEASVRSIQNELYTNGPIEVAFEVYMDFLDYQGGIYIHQGGALAGGHAVKLIGWGEEGGVPYWTVANSWNSDWGENGFFRIIRGKDECGIESGAVAGIPDLSRSPRSVEPEENWNSNHLHHHRRHHYE